MRKKIPTNLTGLTGLDDHFYRKDSRHKEHRENLTTDFTDCTDSNHKAPIKLAATRHIKHKKTKPLITPMGQAQIKKEGASNYVY